jgi:hypothetical protein
MHRILIGPDIQLIQKPETGYPMRPDTGTGYPVRPDTGTLYPLRPDTGTGYSGSGFWISRIILLLEENYILG